MKIAKNVKKTVTGAGNGAGTQAGPAGADRHPSDIDVSNIADAEHNIHRKADEKTDGALRALANSIKTSGMIHRIVVRPNADGKPGYIAVDGHRRLAAARLLGWETVPCEIIDTADAHKALALAMAANIQRSEDDPLLEADAIKSMLDSGMSREEIAAALGKTVAFVARRARLINLDDAWRRFAAETPCTVDLLERVAAFEKSLQKRVANDVDLAEFEFDGEGPVPWSEFAVTFTSALRRIEDAAFDTKVCQNCEHNTACHAYLFSFMAGEDGNEDARCEDEACYVRRNNEAVDAETARIKAKGIAVREVSSKWNIPNSWNASKRRTKSNTAPYVYLEGCLKKLLWSQPPPEKASAGAAKTPEEKAAEKAEKTRARNVREARDKIRELLDGDENPDSPILAFFKTEEGQEAYNRIARNNLDKALADVCISDVVCDAVFGEVRTAGILDGILTDDEADAYGAECDAANEDASRGTED